MRVLFFLSQLAAQSKVTFLVLVVVGILSTGCGGEGNGGVHNDQRSTAPMDSVSNTASDKKNSDSTGVPIDTTQRMDSTNRR